MILGIDTSGLLGGVALVRDGKLMAEFRLDARSATSERILPQINHLLEDLGVTAENIKRIGVSIGPGSFTGLRVGLSTAKGLCLGWNVPLMGVSSLRTRIIALDTELPTLAVTAHRRGSLFAGALCRAGGREVTLLPEATRLLSESSVWVTKALEEAGKAGFSSMLCTGDAAILLYNHLRQNPAPASGGDQAGFEGKSLVDRLQMVPGFPGSNPGVVALITSVADESSLIQPSATGNLVPQYLRGSDARLPGSR